MPWPATSTRCFVVFTTATDATGATVYFVLVVVAIVFIIHQIAKIFLGARPHGYSIYVLKADRMA